jgi:hypothetical protein
LEIGDPKEYGGCFALGEMNFATDGVSFFQDYGKTNDCACFFSDDDRDDRPTRRHRYEEPVASRLRRDILVIAESVSLNCLWCRNRGDRQLLM